jgi:hypothetical protein
MTVTLGTEKQMLLFEGEELSCFTAGAEIVPGFVKISGTERTVIQATAYATGATKLPIGVVTASYETGDTGVSVRSTGVVKLIADASCSAGDPVYPADTAGRFQITVAAGLSGIARMNPLGTVLKGASASGAAWVKLKNL